MAKDVLRRLLIALSDRSPAFTPKPVEVPGFVGIARRGELDDMARDMVRESEGIELLAYATAAAITAEGWRGDIGPAVKAITVAMLRRADDDDMADVVESLPCHIHIKGRE